MGQPILRAAVSTLDLFAPAGIKLDSYYKLGPTASNPADHWYEFLFDGTRGAELLQDRAALRFVNGGRGDDDLQADGCIVKPGVPASAQSKDFSVVDSTGDRDTGLALVYPAPPSSPMRM